MKLVECVAGGGQHALALAGLVHRALVARELALVLLLDGLEPHDGRGREEHLGVALQQDGPLLVPLRALDEQPETAAVQS